MVVRLDRIAYSFMMISSVDRSLLTLDYGLDRQFLTVLGYLILTVLGYLWDETDNVLLFYYGL